MPGTFAEVPGTFAVAFNCVADNAVPSVIPAGVAHAITGVAFATVKLRSTGVAAAYVASPAWLALTVTAPAPVSVSVLPVPPLSALPLTPAVPATVVTTPLLLTLRIVWLKVSAT